MKKAIAIILTLTAFSSVLSGCSGQKESNNNSSQVEITTVQANSQTIDDIQKIEQGYMDNGLQGALDASINKPYYIWFPKGTSPRSCACGYASMPANDIIPICLAGSLEYSPSFDVDITQIKTNEDIIPVMTNQFSKLVGYADTGYQDDGRIEILSTENKTIKDVTGTSYDACYSKGEYFYKDFISDKENKFQFVAYSLMWDEDTPFFAAVLDVSEKQNKLAECEEALEFMMNTLRKANESEY